MESDQFAMIALTAMLSIATDLGTWPLLIPAYKYAFELFFVAVGSPAVELGSRKGENRWAKIICASSMVALILALCPFSPPWVVWTTALTATGLIGFSFGAEALDVLRRRRTLASSLVRAPHPPNELPS